MPKKITNPPIKKKSKSTAPQLAFPITFDKVDLFSIESIQLVIHHVLKFLDALFSLEKMSGF